MPTKRFDKLSEERKRAVLHAAAHEFITHGYAGASINRIVTSAGTSKGALYYWFEDKEDILSTVSQATIERFAAMLGEPEEPETAEAFWAWAERFCRDSIRFYREDPQAIPLVQCVFEAVDQGHGLDAIAAYKASLDLWFSAFIASASRLGVIDLELPPDLLLMMLTSTSEAIDRWLAQHVGDLDDAQIDALGTQILEFYRRLARR